ncbi:hypothetical protein MLD38_034880 [Melastoma candidum]|uniref:Uncharacterized protein n=1 Tax=Melastoma candidum TaxID=119954 RepID=A0ACB9MCS2_9MYRT|nr:hypothetical protein MLD38_034880 [Melastoma candidum]
MLGWDRPALAIGVVVVMVLVVITAALLLRWFLGRRGNTGINGVNSIQDGLAKLHHASTGTNCHLGLSSRRLPGYSVFCHGTSGRLHFSWTDHPSSMMDAAESSLSGFTFMRYNSCPSSLPSLRGACATGDPQGKGEMEPVISWVAAQGSADFMQKIRLNPGLKQVNSSSPVAAACVIKTASPLPVSPLGDKYLPPEVYFEITIQESRNVCDSTQTDGENERTKLILDDSEMKANSESLEHIASDQGHTRVEEMGLNVKEDGPDEDVLLSVGLTAGDSVPLKLPGTYAGSIGFNSNGTIHHDESKVMFKCEKADWGMPEKVIGCGFDPSQKEVFFTVDSELVQVIHCQTEEFGLPLYPTLAANSDMTVLVNFGQVPFKYSPMNAHRALSPCFKGTLANSPPRATALVHEDSRELFSMGRIDSQWLHRSLNNGGHVCPSNNSRRVDFDQESDADLFEIVLDGVWRSPTAKT